MLLLLFETSQNVAFRQDYYMKQNKSCKQTLESAQNGLEIIFNTPGDWENSWKLSKPETQSPNYPFCLDEAMKPKRKCSLAY